MQKILFCYASAIEVSHLKNTLENANYLLICTNNGKDIIDMAKAEKPDMIYMDIMMLGAKYYQVMTTLQSDPETKNIPIIIFSEEYQKANRMWSQLKDARSLIVKVNLERVGA